MPAWSTIAPFDRAFFARLADWLAVAVVLPWSTTATGICIAAWLLVLLPTLDVATVRREVATAAGGLPVLLWCLGAVGMLWADVDWSARFGGLDGFNRLLMIPLLLAQFRRSEHGGRVICGFLFSATVLIAASYILRLTPGLTWRGNVIAGVPAHDDIFQGAVVLICGFGSLGYAAREGKSSQWRRALAYLILGAFFLANFAFVVSSRAAIAVVPVLALFLGWRIWRGRGVLGTAILAVVIGVAALLLSSTLHRRMNQSIEEIQAYRATGKATSIGMHVAFLKESMVIVSSAPIIGHGTGAIPQQFRQATSGGTGAAAVVTVNPHNQTFAVAIQIGLVGAIVLWSMWIAHLLLFRGEGVVAWLGTVVVVENVISSTVHTHLFDFNSGWLYVFAVGVLGGMVLRERATPAA
jgi:O-antigen ligase